MGIPVLRVRELSMDLLLSLVRALQLHHLWDSWDFPSSSLQKWAGNGCWEGRDLGDLLVLPFRCWPCVGFAGRKSDFPALGEWWLFSPKDKPKEETQLWETEGKMKWLIYTFLG